MSDESTTEKLKIMAVMCHPADAIDGAGGTLALHADRGDEVTMVVLTHGVDTHELERNDAIRFGADATPSEHRQAIGRKEKEVAAGMAILGVHDVRFLRFPDELVLVTREMIEKLASVMAEVQPHLLIIHNPTESRGLGNVGHADSAIATLKAIPYANSPQMLKQPSGRTFPMQVFMMNMNGQTDQLTYEGLRYGNVLVDITPVVERKVKAMDCLESQYYPGNLARKVIEDVNGRMGLHFRMNYAEAFQTLKPHGYQYLPVNEHLKNMMSSSAKDKVLPMRIMVNDVPFEPGS